MVQRFSSFLLPLLWGIIFFSGGCALPEEKKEMPPSGPPVPPPAFVVEHGQPLPDRSVRTSKTVYDGPIFDTHLHIAPPRHGVVVRSPLREIVDTLTTLNVEDMIFMPTPNEGRLPYHQAGVKQRQLLARLGKGRIRLFCGSDYVTTWLQRAFSQGYKEEDLVAVMQRLTNDLDSGKYSGVGEIGIYHFKKLPHQKIIAYPPNFEPFLKIQDLVTQKGVWLDVHAEPVDPAGKSYAELLFGGLDMWFRRNPDLKLILSHTALTNPSNARRILQTYPNVMMNIRFETFEGFEKYEIWKHLGPIVNRERMLYEDWAVLFEEMPDRFMIGTDEVSGGREFDVRRYRKRIKWVRRNLLGALQPEAARLIAYENASRIFP